MTPVAVGEDAFAFHLNAPRATTNSTIDPAQAQTNRSPYAANAVKVRANGTRANPAAATAFADGLKPSSDAVKVFPDAGKVFADETKAFADAGKVSPDAGKESPDAREVSPAARRCPLTLGKCPLPRGSVS
jgi:hypothetical protein